MYEFSESFKKLAMLYQLNTSKAELRATKTGGNFAVEVDGATNDVILLLALAVANVSQKAAKNRKAQEKIIAKIFDTAQQMAMEETVDESN